MTATCRRAAAPSCPAACAANTDTSTVKIKKARAILFRLMLITPGYFFALAFARHSCWRSAM